MSKINDVQKVIWSLKNDNSSVDNNVVKLLSSVANPSLLMNGDFKINQRGNTGKIVAIGYTIADRWKLESGAYEKVAGGVKLTAGTKISQWVEGFDKVNTPLTISVCTDSGVTAETSTVTIIEGAAISKRLLTTTDYYVDFIYDGTYSRFALTSTLTALVVNYIKVEVGQIATRYFDKPFAEELRDCQRYFLKVVGGRYASIAFEANAWSFIPTPTTMCETNLAITIVAPGLIHNLDYYSKPLSITWFYVKSNGIDMQVTHSYSLPSGSQTAVWEDVQMNFEAEA